MNTKFLSLKNQYLVEYFLYFTFKQLMAREVSPELMKDTLQFVYIILHLLIPEYFENVIMYTHQMLVDSKNKFFNSNSTMCVN